MTCTRESGVTECAIPKLMSARATSVQAATSGTMRALVTSLASYQSKYGNFPTTDLTALGGDCTTTAPTLTASCQMDNAIVTSMNSGTFSSYTWNYVPSTGGGSYVLTASPAPGVSNLITRYFWASEGATIHYADGAAATGSSPVIGQ